MRNNIPILNVYKNKTLKSEVVTQLLYGDIFKKLNVSKKWIKIINNVDNYIGYIKNKKFLKTQKNTHKVFTLYANLYSKPNINYIRRRKLCFGSKIKVLKEKKNFYNFDNFWIQKKNLKKINYKATNIFFNLKKFVNTKYKWGGKSYKGIDCSALVQVFFNFNNRFCPRDTKDQINFFKKKVKLNNIRKNDLIFWKGHVAIVVSKTHLVHAFGPLKKTVIMPIQKTINIIYKKSNLKVIGIRRVN